jgi:hypothetical protein
MDFLNLRQLSERTGVSETKLQMCIDNGLTFRDWLLPEFYELFPTMIDAIAAMHATMAARLTELGFGTDGAKWLMRAITAFIPREHNSLNLPPLADALASDLPAYVQIGDGELVRWKLNQYDSGWHKFQPAVEPVELATPFVIVAVDVAAFRDRVLGKTSS